MTIRNLVLSMVDFVVYITDIAQCPIKLPNVKGSDTTEAE